MNQASAPPVNGFGAPFTCHTQHINISVNTPPPAVFEQQTEITPRMLEAQQPRASRSFLGRMVQRFTESKRYQKAASYAKEAVKPLKEMTIDVCGALKIVGKETWKGATWGILGGFAAGFLITAYCPPLVGTAFTAGVSAGATAGGIIGFQIGLDKAVDFFNAARRARKAEAYAEMQQQITGVPHNPFQEQIV